MKSTERFSDRVVDYLRYRPSYPESVIDDLAALCSMTPWSVVADVGSGTGKLTELFIKGGFTVIGVEPNAEMREAAEQIFSSASGFRSVAGSAENTLLDDESVDLIVAGQAFHWFDPLAAKSEFTRVLKPKGKIALIWNQRSVEKSFQYDYDTMLREYCEEYTLSNHRNVSDADIAEFCAPRAVKILKYDYKQQFNLTGFLGRMYSASYTPAAGTDKRRILNQAAQLLFEKHARGGVLDFEYETVVYLS